ncbi:hypothetical protein MtrunA17_Chr6g0479691 [Medicago truncatula]|uniref:Uncharacterized protein n=1 Tax=Medicago truncatula TaxID=3880 RepID=A0A396HKG5_MEDTR|nr:hypothetical protein MtrunA17_Chr6g0479691 [Medicago truncatula]
MKHVITDAYPYSQFILQFEHTDTTLSSVSFSFPPSSHRPNMTRRRQHLHLLSPLSPPNTTPSSTQFHRRIPSRCR